MNRTLGTFLLAVIPALLLMIYIYFRDTKKEPVFLLLKAFLYGALSVLLVFAIHSIVSFFGINVQQNVILQAFISAGLIEEGCKFFLLKKLIWNNPNFDERFDGIVYAVFVSLGFAVVENLLYLFVYTPETAIATGFQRAIWAVPAHFLFAVVMGYYLSLAKFNPTRKTLYLSLSLLMAVFVHGMYDVLLMLAEFISQFSTSISAVTMLFFYLFDIILWKMGLKRMKRHTLADKYNDLTF